MTFSFKYWFLKSPTPCLYKLSGLGKAIIMTNQMSEAKSESNSIVAINLNYNFVELLKQIYMLRLYNQSHISRSLHCCS